MRFVPAFCVREGMVLAKNLYGKSGELMLSEGNIITNTYFDSINRLQYNGIYINDDISNNIEIKNVIDDNLRIESVKKIKEIFIYPEKNKPLTTKHVNSLKTQIDEIVDELLENQSLMVNMVDLKFFDDYTYFHSVNVTVLSIIIGISLQLNRKELFELGLGALLHDIGKVFVKKEVLNKNGKLTQEEFEEVKMHSVFGYQYLKKEFEIPVKTFLAVLSHHEKFTGGGYPEGTSGEKISLFGRIINIADVYDALISDRPYRLGLLPSEAMEYIMGGSGSLFDPKLVQVFAKKVAPYPIGSCVVLSNNNIGIILENYEECCMRPLVRVFEHDGKKIEPYIIDMSKDRSLTNVTIIAVANV